jgi:spoIIIJ-associated protein
LPTSRDPIERAKSFVQELIILLGCTAQLSVRANETPVVFELSGADAGFLIGRHGQMLDAIEYLANRVAVSEPVESARILVDAQGYRERRRLYLEGLAKRLGAQVRSRKKSVTLEPMSPRDRRTVHVALQNEPGVVTKSTGEGYYRRVVISPAEPAGSRSRPSRS